MIILNESTTQFTVLLTNMIIIFKWKQHIQLQLRIDYLPWKQQ